MAQTKHTAGPWEMIPGADPHYDVKIVGDRAPDEDDPTLPDSVVVVARVYGNATSVEVTAANACLIAASPLLLAELKRVEWGGTRNLPAFSGCSRCCPTCRGFDPSDDQAWQLDTGHAPGCTLAAAILKAEGRAS